MSDIRIATLHLHSLNSGKVRVANKKEMAIYETAPDLLEALEEIYDWTKAKNTPWAKRAKNPKCV